MLNVKNVNVNVFLGIFGFVVFFGFVSLFFAFGLIFCIFWYVLPQVLPHLFYSHVQHHRHHRLEPEPLKNQTHFHAVRVCTFELLGGLSQMEYDGVSLTLLGIILGGNAAGPGLY